MLSPATIAVPVGELSLYGPGWIQGLHRSCTSTLMLTLHAEPSLGLNAWHLCTRRVLCAFPVFGVALRLMFRRVGGEVKRNRMKRCRKAWELKLT